MYYKNNKMLSQNTIYGLYALSIVLIVVGTFLTIYYGRLWDRENKDKTKMFKATNGEKAGCVFGGLFLVSGIVLSLVMNGQNTNLRSSEIFSSVNAGKNPDFRDVPILLGIPVRIAIIAIPFFIGMGLGLGIKTR